ncbi:MAG TPA: POTRA domain-containing protein [Polyangiaceae bacterium]
MCPWAVDGSPRRALSLTYWSIFVGLLAAITTGCVRKERPDAQYIITELRIEGARQIEPRDVAGALSTRESSRLLGIHGLEGILFDYAEFDESELAQDLERIERYYRARGYYECKVYVARVERDEARGSVSVTIRIHEGQPVLVERVTPRGLEQLPAAVGFRAQRAITLPERRPFDEADYDRSKRGILEVLGDSGYAFSRVDGNAQVDIARHHATVDFAVTAGKPSVYGPIVIEGLGEIPETIVRSTLKLREGDVYRASEIREAENALINLGVFASVRIEAEGANPATGTVPLLVKVREASLRAVRLGIGVAIDPVQFRVTPRLGWEDQNFLGGLRRLMIDDRPGLVLYPTRTADLTAPTKLLPQNRLLLELRQPAFIEGRTTGFTSTSYNIYPLLFPLPEGKDPATERILGYHEFRETLGVERSFFDLRVLLTPSVTLQTNIPVAYQRASDGTAIPRGIHTLHILYPELTSTLDLRDDRIEPHRGILVQNSVQVAIPNHSPALVGDVRIRPELRTYVPVSKRSVLATRIGFGFLLPINYGTSLGSAATNPSDEAVVSDQQKLLFRAFYSGGPNSNRGYGYSEVGPHGPLGLLLPGTVDCLAIPDAPDCIRPLGGLTLWEASMEVRFPISGALRGVTFIDASDVTRERGRLRLSVPHLSPGIGLRYDTPIGPLRLDIGYRLLERTGAAPKVGAIRDEAELHGWFGSRYLPLALHIALGEAF